MKPAYLLLGSNLGKREQNLFSALELIMQSAGEIINYSSIYETEPWGNNEQPGFLNQVVEIRTRLTGEELLSVLAQIEKERGRVRHEKWGPRILDIDILYFSNEIIVKKELKVPHPGIADRKFTLIPLAEIAPHFIHPVLNLTNSQLLEKCTDNCKVSVFLPSKQ